MRLHLLVGTLLVCALACGGKSDDTGDKQGTDNKAKKRLDLSKRRLAPNKRRLAAAPTLTVAEVEKALQLPKELRRLEPPLLMSHNRVVRTTYCADGTDDVSKVIDSVAEKLKSTGWKNVRTAPKKTEVRRGASAQKGLMRAAIMAQQAELPKCAKSKQQTRVLISIYKLTKAPRKMVKEALRKHRARVRKKNAAGAGTKTAPANK